MFMRWLESSSSWPPDERGWCHQLEADLPPSNRRSLPPCLATCEGGLWRPEEWQGRQASWCTFTPPFLFLQELWHFHFPSLSTRVVVCSLFLSFLRWLLYFHFVVVFKRCPSFFVYYFFVGFFYVYFHFPTCFVVQYFFLFFIFILSTSFCQAMWAATLCGAIRNFRRCTNRRHRRNFRHRCTKFSVLIRKFVKGEKWKDVKTAIDTTEETCWHVNFGQFCKSVI